MAESVVASASAIEPPDEVRQEGFRVTDLGGATWAMRKLHRLCAQQAAIEEAAEAEIDRITEWRNAEVVKLNDNATYFEVLLADYHRERLAEDEKCKTIRLPHGTLKCRVQQPIFDRDEVALLEYAKRTDASLVEVKESAKWADIKARGDLVGETLVDRETGEVIPVKVTLREPKFSAEVEL